MENSIIVIVIVSFTINNEYVWRSNSQGIRFLGYLDPYTSICFKGSLLKFWSVVFS